ncbi:polymorphic toxin-type HINT domain-containing protein [Streptomyces gardneri]|uniref:polymorphic toxin-type HINT domain-containing protein n=1 Tax=Streptomyces gardneri TaxID=66892 RepID=UPI00340774CC
MLSGLVSATPAAAEEPAVSERGQVLAFWKKGGAATKAAAGAAMTGSNADIRAFLDKGRAIAENLDDREAALQVVADGGPALRKAAEAALASTPEQLDTFLKVGWKQPIEQDQRVETARIGEAGGKGLKAAADVAMNGDIEAVRQFLSEGQYKKRDSDARVRVAQIEATGGPKTRAAASAALNGSIDDVREFLAVGQHVARAQDQEYATVSELAQQAKEAGEQADREAKAAKGAADKAVALAALARKETEKAAAEAKAAQSDAARAADAARRAAESTRRAAQAAQAAISSARAANAAAQVAAAAAVGAANAAAGAARAATEALRSAANGKRDEILAAQARKAADAADTAATAADRAAISGDAAADAARAAASSTANATLTAAAAEEAGGYADAAGANSAEARAAAATARRHAAEANRAANASAAHASDAARHARDARDAARSAATHARNAADAALKAGQHAAGSQAAADESKTHAEASLRAANASVAAVEQARKVHDLARKSAAEELAIRKAAGLNQAKDLKAAYDKAQAEATKAETDAAKLETDFTALSQQAAQPGADAAQVAVAGRKMALAALQTRSVWSRAAAEAALAASDDLVVEYARNGWRTAEEQDDRDYVRQLVLKSPYEDVSTAASAALNGDAAQVRAFIRDGQHQVAASDYRVEIAKIGGAGGPAVKKAADTALNASGTKPLIDFLTKHQYTARDSDDRVRAAWLAENGGDEVKASAEIAIESPTPSLHTFIETGQYKAARKDQVNSAHVAQIQYVIAGSAQVAALSQQRAAEALKSAATAQGAASDAQNHAAQAQTYADNAASHASQARQSADQAAASAKKAAESAATARNAQQKAASSARSATASAAWAVASASVARGYAADAHAAAESARQSAINAGQDATAAAAVYQTHLNAYLAEKANESEADWWRKVNDYYQASKDVLQDGWDSFDDFAAEAVKWWVQLTPQERFRLKLEGLHLGLDIIGLIPGFGEPADLINCAFYGLEGWAFEEPDRYIDAALSCASAIPVGGYIATGFKANRWYDKAKKLWDTLNGFRKKRGSQLPPCATRNSFLAGTRVLMGDGSSRPIEQVRVGDMVQASDPTTGVTGPRRVTNTIYTPDDRHFTDITLNAAAGGATLTATDGHPFWSETAKQWTDAADLEAGQTLRAPGGTRVHIATVQHWSGLLPAYNLTVYDLHTYYVLAGNTPVLVHNTDPACGLLEGERDYDVYHPETGNRITDIDHVGEGVLWEEKSALYGDDAWITKQIDGKLKKYIEARQYMSGYENAPIGFRLTNPSIDPRFRSALESHIDRLRRENPGVDIRLEFTR